MTDQKQAPERIWIDTFSEKERGPNWNKKPVWAATEYVRKDLYDAAIKQRDELAAALEAAEKRIADLTEELNMTTRQGLIYKNERDQALAASAAREIAMRDRAAERIELIGFSAGLIQDLPLSPDGQQALNDMLADAWVDGMWAGLGEDGPVFDKNPHRKGAT